MEVSDYQDYIIQYIKRVRTEKGVSQVRLAEELGISKGQLGNIENPDYPHKYTLKQLSAACALLDLSIEDLFLPEKPLTAKESEVVRLFLASLIEYEQ